MAELKDGKFIEVQQVTTEVSCEELCRMRDHYKADIAYYQAKLDEVEEKIAQAKALGFVEEVKGE